MYFTHSKSLINCSLLSFLTDTCCMMLILGRGSTFVVTCTWGSQTWSWSWIRRSPGCWSSHPGAVCTTGNPPTWSKSKSPGPLSLICSACGSTFLSLNLMNIWSVIYLICYFDLYWIDCMHTETKIDDQFDDINDLKCFKLVNNNVEQHTSNFNIHFYVSDL